MRREYDKLVRDLIPEIIRSSGKTPVCRTVDRETALNYLAEKLCEEAEEYRASRETEELVDVLEVLMAIAAEKGISWREIEAIRSQKARDRGGFSRRIVLEAVETAGGSDEM